MAVEISDPIKIPPGIEAISHTDGRKIPFLATPAVNEIQTMTGDSNATGGTFAVTFGTQKTGPIVFNATAAVVQAALRLLSNIGNSGISCTGGPLSVPTDIVCTFDGILSGTDVALMVIDDALLTGTAPAYGNTTTTAGTAGGGEKIGDIIQRDTDGTTSQAIGIITDVGAENLQVAKGKRLVRAPVLAASREDIGLQIEGIVGGPGTAAFADAQRLTWDGAAFVANATGAHLAVGAYDGISQTNVLVDINKKPGAKT